MAELFIDAINTAFPSIIWKGIMSTKKKNNNQTMPI
jgi:hypothetical protein